MRNIPLHIAVFCQVVSLSIWITFIMQIEPINLASEQPLFSGGDTEGGPNNPNSSWQMGPAPQACPWLTPAERDNHGFKKLTVNVPGFPDCPLIGSIGAACQWENNSADYTIAIITLPSDYWLLNLGIGSGAWAGNFSKRFGGGPGGAYTLVTTFSGTPPAIVIVTIP